MAESPYREYQELEMYTHRRARGYGSCGTWTSPASIEEYEKQTICEDLGLTDGCMPNPNAVSPNWREQTEPFLNEKTCLYSVPVVTSYVGTGGDELEARLEEHIEPGIKILLAYYGKAQSDSNIATLKEVAEFVDYHVGGDFLIPRHNTRMKALLVVPASYFDLIATEQATSAVIDPAIAAAGSDTGDD